MARAAVIALGVLVLAAGGLSLWHGWWLASGEAAFCEDLARERQESGAELIAQLGPYVNHRHAWLTGLAVTQMVAGVVIAGIAIVRWPRATMDRSCSTS